MAESERSSTETRPSVITRGARIFFNLIRGRSPSDSGEESEKNGYDVGEPPNLSIGQDAQAENIHAENVDRRRDVQSLPPWIHSLRQGENVEQLEANSPLIPAPPRVKPAHHNHLPEDPKREPNVQAGRGRQWNHLRSKEAVTPGLPGPDYHSRWAAFAQSTVVHGPASEERQLVSQDWLKDNLPDLDEPWRPAASEDDLANDKRLWLFSHDKRLATLTRVQHILMKNPFIPLLIRLTVLGFTLAALALGVRIYRRSETLNGESGPRTGTDVGPSDSQGGYICKQQTSTYMAFIVDSIAVVYLGYVTYDEYFSKPLGLRSSKAKMRLLFLDLLFIIFSAANLSLAFNTLTDKQWSCFTGDAANSNNEKAARSTCVQDASLCFHQRGLCSVLLIAEIAWVLTFSISVLRIVERMQG